MIEPKVGRIEISRDNVRSKTIKTNIIQIYPIQVNARPISPRVVAATVIAYERDVAAVVWDVKNSPGVDRRRARLTTAWCSADRDKASKST